MQEKVKDVYREQGNAIEQERLERVRADLRIATVYNNSQQNRDRQKPRENRHS